MQPVCSNCISKHQRNSTRIFTYYTQIIFTLLMVNVVQYSCDSSLMKAPTEESDIETWLKENKLTSLLNNEQFIKYINEQEATVEDIVNLNDKELKLK